MHCAKFSKGELKDIFTRAIQIAKITSGLKKNKVTFTEMSFKCHVKVIDLRGPIS